MKKNYENTERCDRTVSDIHLQKQDKTNEKKIMKTQKDGIELSQIYIYRRKIKRMKKNYENTERCDRTVSDIHLQKQDKTNEKKL